MRTVLAASGCARTGRCELTCWRRRCGSQVCRLLQDPQRLAQEYQRRLQEPYRQENRAMLEAQATKLKQGLSRLIDSYADGLIDKQEFQPRVERSKEKLRKLEQAMQALIDQEAQQQPRSGVILRLGRNRQGLLEQF